MTEATIYHNPRCSKSRNTLSILTENNISVTEVRYLDSPPTKEELAELCKMMGVKPFDIIRTGEAEFKALGLSKTEDRSDDEWSDLFQHTIMKLGIGWEQAGLTRTTIQN
jgi:arsenate reductase